MPWQRHECVTVVLMDLDIKFEVHSPHFCLLPGYDNLLRLMGPATSCRKNSLD